MPALRDNPGTEDFRVLIAGTLKALRHASGLTQEEISVIAQIDVKTYQRYEYGEIFMPMSKSIRIAQALGCSLDDFVYPSSVICPPPQPPTGLMVWLQKWMGRRTPPVKKQPAKSFPVPAPTESLPPQLVKILCQKIPPVPPAP